MTDTQPVALCAWCINRARGYVNSATWCLLSATLLSMSWTGIFGGAQVPNLKLQIINSVILMMAVLHLMAIHWILGREFRHVVHKERPLNVNTMRMTALTLLLPLGSLACALVITVARDNTNGTAVALSVSICILGVFALLSIFKARHAVVAGVVSQQRAQARCPHPLTNWRST